MSKQTPWEFVQDPKAGWDDVFTLRHHRARSRKWLGENLATETLFEDPMELHRYRIAMAEEAAQHVAAIVELSQRLFALTGKPS